MSHKELFSFRVELERLTRWREIARHKNMTLSEWIRSTLDLEADCVNTLETRDEQ